MFFILVHLTHKLHKVNHPSIFFFILLIMNITPISCYQWKNSNKNGLLKHKKKIQINIENNQNEWLLQVHFTRHTSYANPAATLRLTYISEKALNRNFMSSSS